MMLENDYDLTELVDEAISGVSYHYLAKIILSGACKPMSLCAPLVFSLGIEDLNLAQSALFYLLIQTTLVSTGALLVKGACKENAENTLKELVNKLNSINVFVGYESLLKSFKYNTEYEVVTTETIIPKILEKKYIAIPGEENESAASVSLVQEHIVGSEKYTLAVGEPQKTYKLVKSSSTV